MSLEKFYYLGAKEAEVLLVIRNWMSVDAENRDICIMSFVLCN
jgi:hypothetical protein